MALFIIDVRLKSDGKYVNIRRITCHFGALIVLYVVTLRDNMSSYRGKFSFSVGVFLEDEKDFFQPVILI